MFLLVRFDRLVRCFLTFPWLVPGRYDFYSWTSLSAFYSALACRPTDSFIILVLALLFRETPILAGGIGVARVVVGAVLLFVFGLEQL